MRVGTTATIKVKRRRLLARRLCCRSGAPLPASPLPKALPGAPPFPFPFPWHGVTAGQDLALRSRALA
jgi:hypothetical protein